jgi:Flp pilus assembly protein TadG
VSRRARRGAAHIEFALVAPVGLMLMYGIAEYSWYMMRSVSVTTAVQESVRLAAFVPSEDDPVATAVSRARQELTRAGLDGDAAQVTAAMTSDSYGEVLSLTARVPYTGLVGLLPVPAALVQSASAFHEGDIGS